MRVAKGNKYYKLTKDGYSEVTDAKPFANKFELDLFTHSYGKYKYLSEGKTGLKLFEGEHDEEGLLFRICDEVGGVDKLKELIEEKIKKHGLSPRYEK